MKMRQRRARFVRDPIRIYRYGTLAYRLSMYYQYQRAVAMRVCELVHKPVFVRWLSESMGRDPVPDDAIPLMQDRTVRFFDPVKAECVRESAATFMQNAIMQISDAVGIPEHMLTAKGLK